MANEFRILIDTNVLIWASVDEDLITSEAQAVLTDKSIPKFVSLASVWEMQIKNSLGKLPLIGPAHESAAKYAATLRAQLLEVKLEHVAALYELPYLHKDPFDRMLLAQCLSEG